MIRPGISGRPRASRPTRQAGVSLYLLLLIPLRRPEAPQLYCLTCSMQTICNNTKPHAIPCPGSLPAMPRTAFAALFAPENASGLLVPVRAGGIIFGQPVRGVERLGRDNGSVEEDGLDQ